MTFGPLERYYGQLRRIGRRREVIMEIVRGEVARVIERRGQVRDVAALEGAARRAIAGAENQFRGSRGRWAAFARREVRRAVAKAHEAQPCACCLDVGVHPVGADWSICACEAGRVRARYVGVDVAADEDEIAAWRQNDQATPWQRARVEAA